MIVSRGVRTALAWGWRVGLLAIAAAVLALMVVTPTEQFGPSASEPEPTKVRRASEPTVEAAVSRPAEYPAIAAHPLFYPTRKPWTPPPAPEPEAPPPVVTAPSPLNDYTLVGVVVSGNLRSAFVKAQANKILTLSEGQEVEGWTLKEITPERLYFSAGDATYEMTGRKPSEIQQ
jgi:hypothetical protein